MKKQKVASMLLLISFATQSLADCTNKRPANENDLKNGKAVSLIKALSSACTNDSPVEFFAQQTTGIKHALLKKSSSEQKEYLHLLCGQLKPSFKNPESIVYSIEQDSSKDCGQAESNLLGKGQNSVLMLRINVAVENAQLKVDEF